VDAAPTLVGMDATAPRPARRWTWVLLGSALLVLGVALHGVTAAGTASTDPLAGNVLVAFVQHGWVRAAAWGSVAGGAALVVRGWSRRSGQPTAG